MLTPVDAPACVALFFVTGDQQGVLCVEMDAGTGSESSPVAHSKNTEKFVYFYPEMPFYLGFIVFQYK